MRKIILSMMVSLDGFIEGPNQDISWHVWDDEMQAYMNEVFDTVDTLLYGRVAYELMLDYWPSAENSLAQSEDHRAFARKMNMFDKIVFSRTLSSVEWNGRLVKKGIKEEMERLKQQPGKNMILFAGANIASTFMELDLIDEYRLLINPIALGSGTPLFPRGARRLNLRKTHTFNCGNVLLCYEPIRS